LSRRAADPAVEAERKAQQERLFALDVERILSGEDKRTTLMIKNIPNKYTQKMLLQVRAVCERAGMAAHATCSDCCPP
jgi:protein phosphatase 1 regulatory subunit 42